MCAARTFAPLYCWFASDVTVAMLVVKNKGISLHWEMNSILIQIWQKNFFCIDHQHGRFVTWLQTENLKFIINVLVFTTTVEAPVSRRLQEAEQVSGAGCLREWSS